MSPRIRRPTMRAAAVATILSLSLTTSVAAHAELVAASPGDGETIVGNPPLINARYDEELDPDGSSLTLVDGSGAEVASGGVAASGEYPTEMWIEDLPTLAPGPYTVRSTTKSASDGDIDRTTWSFTIVAATGPTPEPTPVCTDECDGQSSPGADPSPPANPTLAASPTASTTGSNGQPASSGAELLLALVAGLAIVVVAAVGLTRRRGRPGPPA